MNKKQIKTNRRSKKWILGGFIKALRNILKATKLRILMKDLTVEKLFSGSSISIHRNKLVTEAFYLTGDIEKQGTGFKRIKDWFKSYPKLSYQVNGMQDFVQITISNISKKLNNELNKRTKDSLFIHKK